MRFACLLPAVSGVIIVTATALGGCGGEPDPSGKSSAGGSAGGPGGTGGTVQGAGGDPNGPGGGATATTGNSGGGETATTTAGSGGGASCGELPAGLTFDDKGCLTFDGASRVCGAKSDGKVCAQAESCGVITDANQCSINCEMGTSVQCYQQEDVDCIVQATCAGSCDALKSCNWAL